MDYDQQIASLLNLTLPERIQLVEDLWDSIAAESESLPLPDWQKENWPVGRHSTLVIRVWQIPGKKQDRGFWTGMLAKLLILAAAEADIDEAFAWYEQRQTGLGFEFMRAVNARIRSIQRNPEMCGFVERHYRQALVRRFPYAILYAYSEEIVTIYAVFPTSRDPAKWRARLP